MDPITWSGGCEISRRPNAEVGPRKVNGTSAPPRIDDMPQPTTNAKSREELATNPLVRSFVRPRRGGILPTKTPRQENGNPRRRSA
eukprot:scaffold30102_cov92-Amphora_coffeaeformis.AAC.1